MPLQSAYEVGGQEGVDPGLRRLGHEVAKAREGHAGGAALVDHGGDAGMNAHHVGVQAEAAADILVDVGVGVDHPRQDQPAAHVDHFLGAGGQDVRLDGGDVAVADRHVHHAVDGRRRDK